MILAYILGIISVIILVSGLVMFVILLFRKVSKLLLCLVFAGALVVATIIGIICVAIFTFSFDNDNANITKENFEEIDKQNEEILGRIKQEEVSNLNEEDNKKEDVKKEIETTELSLKDQGKIKNTDHNFIITVGEEEVNKIRVVKVNPFEGVTNSYMYCYKTMDTIYEGSLDCNEDETPIFSINIYTKDQWAIEAVSPFAGTVMGQDGGYYFVFYRPNGILPIDIPSTEEYYNSVIQSIDFAD
jgi:hypothetical protein